MSQFKTVVFSFILTLGVSKLFAQARYGQILDHTYLEYVDRLPRNLISEKSIGVLIADTRDQAQKLAETAHPSFAKSGVDVVAYYHVDDLFAGKALSKGLADEFLKREIIQLIFLTRNSTGYQVVITPFSKDEKFVKHGKKAWKLEAGQLSEIMDQMDRMSVSLEKKNFLVSDTPEMGRITHKVNGRRYEAYKPDLKTEKLAIPLLTEITLPKELQGRSGLDKIKNNIVNYNQQLVQENERIKSAFVNYPYPHEFITEELTEKQLRSKGYNYVLNNIHTTSNTIRDLLKYEKTQGVTDFIVVRMNEGKGEVVRIKGDVPVYKYYVRNIPSDTYYLGAKWDADLTDEASLNNHVQLLIAEIR